MRPAVAYACSGVAVALGVVASWWATVHGGPALAGYMESYLAATVVLASICLFLAFRSAAPTLGRFSRSLSWLASLTFGVYLIHLIVATEMFMVLRPIDTSVRQFTPVYVATLLMSFGLCAIIGRVRHLRWVIGL